MYRHDINKVINPLLIERGGEIERKRERYREREREGGEERMGMEEDGVVHKAVTC